VQLQAEMLPAFQREACHPLEPSRKESLSHRRELRAHLQSASHRLPAAVVRAV
jgi:hypothetical protein